MLYWDEGPPKGTGLFVVEWGNLGGFSVIHVRDFDGILFAFGVKTYNDTSCTRLDKWYIARHCAVPFPAEEIMHKMFSHSGEAQTKAKEERT